MPILDSLEKRFGRYAIRGLVGYIVFFQCITFAVLFTKPEFAQALTLKPFAEMDGEWWRLLSFMAVPASGGPWVLSPLMFIFYAGVLLFIMHPVEAALGTFRMNLFVLLFILVQWGQAALWGTSVENSLQVVLGGFLNPSSAYFYDNLFFAFAVLHPGMVFRLYGLVPVPAWVLGLVSGGLILLSIIRVPLLWLSSVLGLAPFLCFGIPVLVRHLRHRSGVAVRRSRFKAESFDPGDSFHKCSVCGRTEGSDPDLDFRVSEDGTEYCGEHLPRN
jgi:hypothetical protein